MTVQLLPTALPGVVLVQPTVHTDARGWFTESYNQAAFEAALAAAGLPAAGPFVQDSQSCSHAGVLRGLHHQLPPHAQGKLVRVLHGATYNVAVDVRKHSPTLGRWVGVALSAHNHLQLWVPPGFAHGFLALQDHSLLAYKTTAHYALSHERRVRFDDPAIGITWPALAGGAAPTLAAADATAPPLAASELHGDGPEPGR
jgi:dTDP-4-dehydrorhamnose 3,5-epimerase